jgi:hypothetical protein
VPRARIVLAIAAATTVLAFAGTAAATVVTYTNGNPLSVPNNTGIAGVSTTIEIPAGRTPVRRLEVPVNPEWPAGGTDMELRLQDPIGNEMFLMVIGCPMMPNGTHFTITDSATVVATNSVAFCSNQLSGGEGKPEDPDGKTLAFFKRKPTGGTWTLFVRDDGILATGGTMDGWALKVDHAPLTLRAKSHKQRLRRELQFRAKCNADCTLLARGDARRRVFHLGQDALTGQTLKLKRRARRRLADGGTARIKLRATDDIDQVATRLLKIKIRAR